MTCLEYSTEDKTYNKAGKDGRDKVNRSKSSPCFDLTVQDIGKYKAQKCYGNGFYTCIDQGIYKSYRHFRTRKNGYYIFKSYKFQIGSSGCTPISKRIIISHSGRYNKKDKKYHSRDQCQIQRIYFFSIHEFPP